jgi:nitrogen fixation protein FixH
MPTARKLETLSPHYLLIAFFGVVISVNILFICLAIRSSNGMFESQPYTRGTHYQEEIDAETALKRSNFQVTFDLKGTRQKIVLSATPARPDSLTLTAIRPNDSTRDKTLLLKPEQDGHFYLESPLERGHWLIRLEFQISERRFLLKKRIFVAA